MFHLRSLSPYPPFTPKYFYPVKCLPSSLKRKNKPFCPLFHQVLSVFPVVSVSPPLAPFLQFIHKINRMREMFLTLSLLQPSPMHYQTVVSVHTSFHSIHSLVLLNLVLCLHYSRKAVPTKVIKPLKCQTQWVFYGK